MRQSLWRRTKRQWRRALLRARRVCTRFEKAAPPRVYEPWSPSSKDCHVLGCKFVQTEENLTPDFEFCDLAMTTAEGSSRNWHANHAYFLRVDWPGKPAYVTGTFDADSVIDPVIGDAAEVLRKKTKFCAFVFENHGCTTRNRFLEILSRSMRVEAGGCTMRSVPYTPAPRWTVDYPEKVATFYRPYKFVLAFENTLSLHYASEKLGTALHAHTVPIYWGNSQIANYFNPERFINAFDFDSLESLAAHVMRVHEDDALYLRYLSAPARTLRQEVGKFPKPVPYKSFSNLSADFRSERKTFFSLYERLTKKSRKAFLDVYTRLMTGRMLPLAQRRMFHRECLARFAQEACGEIVQERRPLEGRLGTLPARREASFVHVWPHPGLYRCMDMKDQLRVKD